MRQAKKKTVQVQAWKLGYHSEMEQHLLETGKIIQQPDGNYQIFSMETRLEPGGKGELAKPGDYFKVDVKDGIEYPYPNTAEYFESHYRKIGENLYETISAPVFFWQAGDPIEEPMRFLLETGRLVLDEQHPESYYAASLWQTTLRAPRDSVLAFYKIEKDENGKIQDVDFNLIDHDVFVNSYTVC